MDGADGGRSRAVAALATVLFVLVLPGPVTVLVPRALSGWRTTGAPWPAPVRGMGAVLIALGLPVLAHAMIRFVREGRGTPAPVLPPDRLVVGGLYRYVRNPMYLAVLAVIVGQGLFFSSPPVLIYALGMAAAFTLFVVVYEEPTLRRQFGAQYEQYCRGVRRWRPRLRAWQPPPG